MIGIGDRSHVHHLEIVELAPEADLNPEPDAVYPPAR